MAEEQRLEEPAGGHRLCANNCGFFGSPTTHNLCSKCYNDQGIKEKQVKEAKLAMETTLTQHSHESKSSESSSEYPNSSPDNVFVSHEGQRKLDMEKSKATNDPDKIVVEEHQNTPQVVAGPTTPVNRCATCRQRVGLTRFKCRCGVTFCGTHRYPEKHGCTFDYKAMGREEIAKANPVVKGQKLEKI